MRKLFTPLAVLSSFLILTSRLIAADIQLENVVTGLSSPVFVTNAHDGLNRLFILEQGGVVKVLQPGSNSPQCS